VPVFNQIHRASRASSALLVGWCGPAFMSIKTFGKHHLQTISLTLPIVMKHPKLKLYLTEEHQLLSNQWLYPALIGPLPTSPAHLMPEPAPPLCGSQTAREETRTSPWLKEKPNMSFIVCGMKLVFWTGVRRGSVTSFPLPHAVHSRASPCDENTAARASRSRRIHSLSTSGGDR